MVEHAHPYIHKIVIQTIRDLLRSAARRGAMG
jgi:hypothetical protein